MFDNLIIWLFVILIVFSTLVVGIMVLICTCILQSVIKLYIEYEKRRMKDKRLDKP